MRFRNLSLFLCALWPALAPCDVIVTPADGSGFDGYYREIDKPTDYKGEFVASSSSYVKVRQFDGGDQVRHFLGLIKFDLSGSGLSGGDVVNANLALTVHGSTKGTGLWTLGAFTGDDSLITDTLRYDAANPLFDDSYVAESDPDTDFAEGAVAEILQFTNQPPGAVDVMGSDDPGFLSLVQDALDGDQMITFLIYGASSEYFFNSMEAAAGAPALTLVTIPEPFLSAEPGETYPGVLTTFNWFAPPGATDITLSPGVGDVSAQTAPNGLGSISIPAPAADTTYTLSYTFESAPVSINQDITILEPHLTVTPESAFPNITTLEINWQIRGGADSVMLEFGPAGGPYDSIDVTSYNDPDTGVGSFPGFIPLDGETRYNIRYTVGPDEFAVSDDIELIDSIFDSVAVFGNSTSFEVLADFATGDLVFTDRTFTWTSLPPVLEGGEVIRLGTTDRQSAFFQTEISTLTPVTLFLLIDNRVGDPLNIKDDSPTLGGGVMDWVVEAGFLDTGLDAMIDENGDLAGDTPCSVFFLQLAANEALTLLEQNDGATRTMYTIVAVSPPVAPVAFGAAPDVLLEYRPTTISWAVPPGSAVTLATEGVSDLDVTSLTDAVTGIGQTQVVPDGTGYFEYTLTYDPPGAGTPPVVLGPVLLLVEAGPDPELTLSPDNAWQGDTLVLSWVLPATATEISISPDVGDVTANTDPSTGIGSVDVIAPGEDTEFVLSYRFEDRIETLEQYFTLNPLRVSITPASAIADTTPVDISWRIAPNADSVILEFGPPSGPYDTIDVTGQTDFATGAGDFPGFVPVLGQTHYRIRYSVSSVESVVSTDIQVHPKIFESVTPSGNTKPVEVNPEPMDEGVLVYSDRTHVWAELPPVLVGAQFVKLGNDDKNNAALSINFTAATDATFFLMIDNRVGDGVGGTNPSAGTDNPPTLGGGVMDWVLGSGFVDSGLDVGLDELDDGSINNSFSIYFRQVAASESFTFLQQADGNTRVLYGIAGIAPQVSPVAFVGSPTTINQGESVTLQWTVPAGSTVSIDQGIGDVTSSTDSGTGVGSLLTTPSSAGGIFYTLTYDPPGEGTPPVALAPVAITVNSVGGGEDFPIRDVTFNSASGEVSFSWAAPPGVTDPSALTDSVERSTTLLESGWQAVTGGVFTITDGVVRFSDPDPPSDPKVYYRVVRP